jgi:hypothetical protein
MLLLHLRACRKRKSMNLPGLRTPIAIANSATSTTEQRETAFCVKPTFGCPAKLRGEWLELADLCPTPLIVIV